MPSLVIKGLAARNLRSVNNEVIRLLDAGLISEPARKPLRKPIRLRSRRMQIIDPIESVIDDDAD